MTYEVRAQDEETLRLFVTGMGQSVIPHGDGQIRITVAREANETTKVETSDPVPPTSGDLASTALINCRHAKIVQVAQQRDTKRNPLLLAQEMESFVHETLQMSSFSAVFASAADALESRQGDCSEHAVLLAALCRAKKIPTRVVIGLVFVPEEGAFFYHMWNDVWIGDRWWSLDATNGQGSVGVDHLPLQVGNLADRSVFELVGKIVPTLNQLEIQVVE